MADTGLKQLHDLLLAEKPDGATHDPATCLLCADSSEGATVKTYTEDELRGAVQAAVNAAVANMRTELDSLKSDATAAETAAAVETRIAEAKAPLEAQILDLQTQLDAAVLATANETARAAALEAEKEAAAQAVTLAARKDERLAKIKEVANFPEEYLAAHADRFVAMDEDAFATQIEDWSQQTAKASEGGLPNQTALTATFEGGGSGGGRKNSAVRDLFAMRRAGVDPRTL